MSSKYISLQSQLITDTVASGGDRFGKLFELMDQVCPSRTSISPDYIGHVPYLDGLFTSLRCTLNIFSWIWLIDWFMTAPIMKISIISLRTANRVPPTQNLNIQYPVSIVWFWTYTFIFKINPTNVTFLTVSHSWRQIFATWGQ